MSAAYYTRREYEKSYGRSTRMWANVSLLLATQVVLLLLKLTATVAWSWWWILTPMWAPAACVLALAVGGWLVGILINWLNR